MVSEELIKQEAPVKVKSPVKRVKRVKSAMKASVKIEVPDTEMQEVVKEELITSVKGVKDVMTAPVMKEFVPPVPSPRQVGEKAPSDNNNNKEGKGDLVKQEAPVKVEVSSSTKVKKVCTVKEEAVQEEDDREYYLRNRKLKPQCADVVSCLHCAMSLGDDGLVGPLIGGAVFGSGPAVGRTWSADGDSVEEPCGRDHVAVVRRLQSRCEAEESGGAEGHSYSCDAEALLPGVDVSATTGMLGVVKLCDESGNAWVTWNWVPKIIMCDSLPEGCSRFFDAIIYTTGFCCR